MASPDPLDSLLDRWSRREPPPPAPEALTQEVWRRIADSEVATGEPSWSGRIEAIFSRPSFAAAFVAACAMFGLFLAEVRVSRLQAQRNVQLAHAYLRLIDPLVDSTIVAQSAAPGGVKP
jgi:hypothetical protein